MADEQRPLHRTRRFFASVTTLDLWLGAFRSSRDNIRNSTELIKRGYRQVKSEQLNGVLVDESFEAAMARLNIDNFKLMVRYQQLRFSGLMMLLVLVGSIALCGYFIVQAQWLGAIGSIGAIAIGFAYTLSHCFRAWQIRTRQLGTLSRFLALPSQWWPRSISQL